MTREKWLVDAAFLLRADLYPIAPVPQKLDVYHGLPDSYDTSNSKTIGGTCFDNSSLHHPCTSDFAAQIYVSSHLNCPLQILEVLIHELVHSSVGCFYEHEYEFEKPAREIGLEGVITGTTAGLKLAVRLQEISIKLGSYPEN